VQSQREGAGLKHFSGSGTAAVGGKRNSNPDRSYLFVTRRKTGIGGKPKERPSKP